MKTKVPSKLHGESVGESKSHRNKPRIRLIRSPRGKIQKLFINGRIERVNLGHDVYAETCIFLPILNQIVVISNVETGVCCYAKPLQNEEKGYQIITLMEQDGSDSDETERRVKLTENAVKGLTFRECALNCADVRAKYLQHLHMRNNNNINNNNLNNASGKHRAAPKLFIRYGERVMRQNSNPEETENTVRS